MNPKELKKLVQDDLRKYEKTRDLNKVNLDFRKSFVDRILRNPEVQKTDLSPKELRLLIENYFDDYIVSKQIKIKPKKEEDPKNWFKKQLKDVYKKYIKRGPDDGPIEFANEYIKKSLERAIQNKKDFPDDFLTNLYDDLVDITGLSAEEIKAMVAETLEKNQTLQDEDFDSIKAIESVIESYKDTYQDVLKDYPSLNSRLKVHEEKIDEFKNTLLNLRKSGGIFSNYGFYMRGMFGNKGTGAAQLEEAIIAATKDLRILKTLGDNLNLKNELIEEYFNPKDESKDFKNVIEKLQLLLDPEFFNSHKDFANDLAILKDVIEKIRVELSNLDVKKITDETLDQFQNAINFIQMELVEIQEDIEKDNADLENIFIRNIDEERVVDLTRSILNQDDEILSFIDNTLQEISEEIESLEQSSEDDLELSQDIKEATELIKNEVLQNLDLDGVKMKMSFIPDEEGDRILITEITGRERKAEKQLEEVVDKIKNLRISREMQSQMKALKDGMELLDVKILLAAMQSPKIPRSFDVGYIELEALKEWTKTITEDKDPINVFIKQFRKATKIPVKKTQLPVIKEGEKVVAPVLEIPLKKLKSTDVEASLKTNMNLFFNLISE